MADSRALDQPATLPVAVAPRPIGTVSTQPVDIHDGDTVTLTGSGWQPYSVLGLEECGPNWCAYLGSAETDIDGAFSTTVTAVGTIPGPMWFDDCAATPQACRFVAIDGESPDPSTAQAGVAFTVDSTPDTVASQYSLDGAAAVHAAAERLQVSDTEYQRIATWVTMFLLGLTGAHDVPHPNGAGTATTISTEYPHAEFPYVSAAAGRYDDSTASFQRDASLVVAQIVAQWPR